MTISFATEIEPSEIERCAILAGLPVAGCETHYKDQIVASEYLVGFAHVHENESAERVARFAEELGYKDNAKLSLSIPHQPDLQNSAACLTSN